MKPWLALLLMIAAYSLSGCGGSNPTSPNTNPTATPTTAPAVVGTATATPTVGGGGPVPTPTETPGGSGTHSVTYEVNCTNCTVNVTFCSSNTDTQTMTVSGNWSQTCAMDSGYEALIVGAYATIGLPPSYTMNILVDGNLVATQSLNGIGPAITCSYWLP